MWTRLHGCGFIAKTWGNPRERDRCKMWSLHVPNKINGQVAEAHAHQTCKYCIVYRIHGISHIRYNPWHSTANCAPRPSTGCRDQRPRSTFISNEISAGFSVHLALTSAFYFATAIFVVSRFRRSHERIDWKSEIFRRYLHRSWIVWIRGGGRR